MCSEDARVEMGVIVCVCAHAALLQLLAGSRVRLDREAAHRRQVVIARVSEQYLLRYRWSNDRHQCAPKYSLYYVLTYTTSGARGGLELYVRVNVNARFSSYEEGGEARSLRCACPGAAARNAIVSSHSAPRDRNPWRDLHACAHQHREGHPRANGGIAVATATAATHRILPVIIECSRAGHRI